MPEKRLYNARGNVMTEAAIDPGFTRDLYVALGEPSKVVPGLCVCNISLLSAGCGWAVC
nr:cytochrome c-type biogenesis CcmF C-terminal domain-containing protein [Aliamphritea spongicola]